MSTGGTVADQREAGPDRALMIENPEVAAAVAELKARWPAIGEAADHPLTEWFCLREQGHLHKGRGAKKGRGWSLLKRDEDFSLTRLVRDFLVIGLVWAALRWFGSPAVRSLAYDIVFPIGFLIYAVKSERTNKVRELGLPYLVLSGKRIKYEEMRLCPFTPEDIVGICVGYEYVYARPGRFPIPPRQHRLKLIAAVVILSFILSAVFEAGWIHTIGAVTVILLGLAIERNGDSHSAICRSIAAARRHMGLAAGVPFSVINPIRILIAVVAGIPHIALLAWIYFGNGPHWCVWLLAALWGAVLSAYERARKTRDPLELFDALITDESTISFCRLINNSADLAV